MHHGDHDEGQADRSDGGLTARVEEAAARVADVTARFDAAVDRVVDAVTPRLRGWLHAVTFPLAVAAGIVLVGLSPTPAARATTAVYALSAALLFGISALYHRGRWSPRAHAVLRRFDHANIFLIIAGTYTPFATLLLDPGTARVLLWTVWCGALAGVAFRVLWVGAPRWLYTPVYIALGWVAAFFLPDFVRAAGAGGTAVVSLIIVGGFFYSIGGVVYALRRPNPSPRWFGFHEVFHAFTLVAFAAHYVAVSLVAYSAA
jgi:hemolysin III